jgi:uncharacterized protein
MTMETFTPWTALLGGIIIGLAAAGYLFVQGRLCGISGMVSDFWLRHPNLSWSGYFILGLVTGGFLLHWFYPKALEVTFFLPYYGIVAAGFLVGFGSKLGGGCTSGHGVCGSGMLNPRSMAAVVVFLITAMLTASLLYHFVIGDPSP